MDIVIRPNSLFAQIHFTPIHIYVEFYDEFYFTTNSFRRNFLMTNFILRRFLYDEFFSTKFLYEELFFRRILPKPCIVTIISMPARGHLLRANFGLWTTGLWAKLVTSWPSYKSRTPRIIAFPY